MLVLTFALVVDNSELVVPEVRIIIIMHDNLIQQRVQSVGTEADSQMVLA